MFNEFQLPDGTIATCAKDVDDYCQRNNVSVAGDYSGDYLKNRRYFLEKAQSDDMRADFVRNYKKEIWLND
jgi:hypothetical protein